RSGRPGASLARRQRPGRAAGGAVPTGETTEALLPSEWAHARGGRATAYHPARARKRGRGTRGAAVTRGGGRGRARSGATAERPARAGTAGRAPAIVARVSVERRAPAKSPAAGGQSEQVVADRGVAAQPRVHRGLRPGSRCLAG